MRRFAAMHHILALGSGRVCRARVMGPRRHLRGPSWGGGHLTQPKSLKYMPHSLHWARYLLRDGVAHSEVRRSGGSRDHKNSRLGASPWHTNEGAFDLENSPENMVCGMAINLGPSRGIGGQIFAAARPSVSGWVATAYPKAAWTNGRGPGGAIFGGDSLAATGGGLSRPKIVVFGFWSTSPRSERHSGSNSRLLISEGVRILSAKYLLRYRRERNMWLPCRTTFIQWFIRLVVGEKTARGL